MATDTLTLAEFMPDQAPINGVASANIVNARPIQGGYRPFNTLATQTDALTSRCQGFIAAIDDAGSVFNIAGHATQLRRRSSAAWTDISGALYGTTSDGQWSFVKWGNEIIATNYVDAMQVATIGSGSFANLSGSPPKAKYITTMGKQDQFLVAGYLNVSSTAFPQRIRWPGIGTTTSWTIAASTQADQQDLSNCSEIRGLAGFDYLSVFTDRGIWRGDYVGPPTIIDFSEVEKGRGCAFPGVLGSWGRLVLFLWEDGFYIFDGTSVTAIGAEKVNRFFFNDVDLGYTDRIRIAPDPANSEFVIAYPGAGSASGVCNHALVWNWTLNRWSYVEFDSEHLALGISVGYTLEGLTAISSSVDALPFSLDSRNWQGGRPSLVAFDTNHKLGAFSGSALAATFDTIEKQPSAGQRSLISGVRPLVDGNSTTVAAALVHRARLNVNPTAESELTADSDGLVTTLIDDRFHRVRIKTYGDFEAALGAQISFSATGTF